MRPLKPEQDFEERKANRPHTFLWLGLFWCLVGVAAIAGSLWGLNDGGRNPLVLWLGVFGGVIALIGGVSGLRTWRASER